MNNNSNASATSRGGIGVFGILGIVFVIAKVFGIGPIAAWSWWWVLAPFWIGFAVALAIIAVVFGVALIVAARS